MLCSACNLKHDRAKSLYSQSKNDLSDKSDQSSDLETDNLTELKVKVIIDAKKNSPPGKWFVFTIDEIKDIYLLQSNLNYHIQKYLDIQLMNDDDYEISYKINGRGQAMCINDDEDFLNLIEDEIMTKKIETNYKPKESDLNENELSKLKLLQNFEINISINGLTTIDVPSTYPAFGMIHATRSKIHNQTISQQMSMPTMLPNTPLTIPTMLPGFNPFVYPYTIPTALYQQTSQATSKCKISLKEFFNELDQLHNGNGAYTLLKNLLKNMRFW
ncbi:hypothetical protein F8M41_004942 [Gigaspora margarita]|uniref:Uncharacterized protein n=1 Tax=Gigaspora margarita TaxID=4874 RepID=A0A8H3X9P9_GIGMA|nr:hypothetical protein F8M41_004942 [Gigaspora margarita]